jgi:hypothetical protein
MTDKESMLQTLGYYIDGGTNGEPQTVAKAFHPSAYMKFIRDGKLIDVPIEDYFTKFIKEGIVQDRKVNIDYVESTGDAGSAKLTIDYPTHRFVDYFNLLKIDGGWLIVSKIFQRIEPAPGSRP